jgi:hypothetical protein
MYREAEIQRVHPAVFFFILHLFNDSFNYSAMKSQMKRLVTTELERMGKEAVVALLKVLSRHLHGETQNMSGRVAGVQAEI